MTLTFVVKVVSTIASHWLVNISETFRDRAWFQMTINRELAYE